MGDYNVVNSFKNLYPTSAINTRKFEKFNNKAVRDGLTNEIAYSDGILKQNKKLKSLLI